ncbi:MAG TPA: type II secretion system protein GspM [Rubellimicrobium sp.]|nr:type II secretion system protein GspM [Rubellimicrobium sp.]
MTRLANLSARERVLLLAVLPAVLLLAGVRFGWQPLQDLRAAREAEIASDQTVARAAAQVGAPITAEAPDPTPFAARVTQSAEAEGLELRRIEPEGERLRVAVEDAPFAQVMLWIADLEAERDVTLSAIELDRRIAPGTVSARLLLEPAR